MIAFLWETPQSFGEELPYHDKACQLHNRLLSELASRLAPTGAFKIELIICLRCKTWKAEGKPKTDSEQGVGNNACLAKPDGKFGGVWSCFDIQGGEVDV